MKLSKSTCYQRPDSSQTSPAGFVRMLRAFSVLFGFGLLLSGCATSSPIKRYAESNSAFRTGPTLMSHSYPTENVYRIYHRASTGFNSIAGLREEAEARAQQFCERQGKGMVVLGEKTSPPPYILGNFPRIEIVFASIEKPISKP